MAWEIQSRHPPVTDASPLPLRPPVTGDLALNHCREGVHTLRVMFSRYRRGQVKVVPSIANQVVEAFEANPRPVLVIAMAMGLSPRQVRDLLYRRGYDADMRSKLCPPAPF